MMVHDQASSLFEEWEAHLLKGTEIECKFQVTATGVVSAELGGTLSIVSGGTTILAAFGSFQGEEVRLQLVGKSGRMLYGNDEGNNQGARPEGLEEALLVGLTRMGILHNLAMLSSGAAPDRVQGGVQDWVQVGDFQMDQEEPSTIRFSLTVAGEPSGNATLTFGEEGTPTVRHQRVVFPEGVMEVEERYSSFVVRS